jgi:CDP-glycerol glycerophosphotransferase (TagB/SpsB family)
LIAYYVDNSIHQIPSFIYIAKVLGGTVLTDGPDSFRILREDFPEVKAELHATRAEMQRRLAELKPEAIIQPDYSKSYLNVKFDTAHIQVFHGTSDKTYGYSGKIRDYDFLLLPGQRACRTMKAAGLLTENNYAIVGYPKADRVFKGEFNREETIKRLGLDPDLPTVLYAPTWQDSKFNTSLPKYGTEVLSGVLEGYNLIVKLHPNTKRYDRRNYRMVETLAGQNPRIKLLGYEYDVIPIMAGADLLIADISAVTHEFLCFDRPFVFLDPRPITFGQRKTWVWRCGPVVKRRGQVWATVQEALAHPEAYAKERQSARKEIFHQPDGHASERAAEAIRDFLEKRRKGQA